MGLTDSLKSAVSQATKKASAYAGSHRTQIAAGLDKVGDLADQATKGRYTSQIATGRDKAKEAVHKMSRPKETVQGEATGKPADAAPDQTPGNAQSPGDQEATK